jgi:hypothetical protein
MAVLRDRFGNNGLYFSSCPLINESDQIKWFNGEPVEVLSAFGGFAAIKGDAFKQVKWSSDFHCDHVNLCFELSRIGSIYILPNTKVFVEVEPERIDLSSFKQSAAQQKMAINLYQKLNKLSSSDELNLEELNKFT